MKRLSRPRSTRAAGFTLIEILVAMAIFLFGVSAVLGLFQVGGGYEQEARARAELTEQKRKEAEATLKLAAAQELALRSNLDRLDEEAKKHKHPKPASQVKEIKLRPRIDEHDLFIKVRRAENFLFHGHKIKLLLQYRYRELEHPEIGMATIAKAIEALAHISTRDNEPKRSGRAIVVGLTPVQQNKRKLVHNEAPGEEDGEDDSAVDNDEGDAE